MRVFRTGKPEFYAEVSDEHLVRGARDQEELRRLRELGVPVRDDRSLDGRGRPLGALTLVMAESSRRYGEADLRLAVGARLSGGRWPWTTPGCSRSSEPTTAARTSFWRCSRTSCGIPLAAIDNAVALLSVSDPATNTPMERRRHRPPRQAPDTLDRRLARRLADHQGQDPTAEEQDRRMSSV